MVLVCKTSLFGVRGFESFSAHMNNCTLKKDGKCKLDILYPHTDASLACDEECYYDYAGTKKDIQVPVFKKNEMKKNKTIKRKR